MPIAATVPSDLGQLLDRAAIIDFVGRMGLAADTRDWEAVRDCFAPRVRVDYASLTSYETTRALKVVGSHSALEVRFQMRAGSSRSCKPAT